MNKITKPELLAPAGNLDILKMAFLYGADAVYCGTPAFAMRSRVGFDLKTLKEGILYAHKIGKKVYITLNSFPHSLEIEKLVSHIEKIVKLAPDALIVADPGTVKLILDNFDIPVHLSTQANVTNQLSANFWKDLGVDRIVLARELSLKEIEKIHNQTDIELEAFVHGAMCMAYSGRCQISNYMTGRDPNRGQCIQACRFKYKMYALEEESREGEQFPVYEDEEGTHILNSKDLCMIEHIPEMIDAGIKSFKIEGRLKSEYYVASVVGAYRKAIDLYFDDPKSYLKSKGMLKEEVEKSANRGFTTGFYFQKPDIVTNNYKSSKAVSKWGYIGRVLKYNEQDKLLTFEAKNYLKSGSILEILTPTRTMKIKLDSMVKDGKNIEIAHANNIVSINLIEEIPKDSLIRVRL